MYSIEFKFDLDIIGHRPTYNIDFFIVHRSCFLQDSKMSYTLRPTHSKYLNCILVMLNYINPIRTDVCYYFNYVWSSFEIVCIALIVFLLRNMNLSMH